MSLLKGETTSAEAARRHGPKVAEVEEWRERFLLGAENAGAAEAAPPALILVALRQQAGAHLHPCSAAIAGAA